MSSGNRPREQKGARKTGLLEHLEATGAAGQRTMSGSLNLRQTQRNRSVAHNLFSFANLQYCAPRAVSLHDFEFMAA